MKIVASPRRRTAFLLIPLFLAFLLHTIAFAAAGYKNAQEIAKANGMEYRDMSEGSIHAAKLVGEGREVVLFANVQIITVNGASAMLSRPVKWGGSALEVPDDAVDIITGDAKPPAAPPTPSALAVKPVSRPPRTGNIRGKVVIDAGHGSPDPGALSVRTGLKEKDINLEIALAVGSHLSTRGIQVIYTRHTDDALKKEKADDLEARAEIANRAHPDLFLCIHTNSEPLTPSKHGALILYPDDGTQNGRAGIMGRAIDFAKSGETRTEQLGAGGKVGANALRMLFGVAFDDYRVKSIRAAHAMQNALEDVTGLVEKNNGLMEDNYRGLYVLRNTHAPAILVEVDFLSNRISERKLSTKAYRSAIADAIADGVLAYLSGENDK